MPLLLLSVGCTPVADDPVAVFDAAWHDFDTLYGGFEARGVDWDEAGDRWRPVVVGDPTDAGLWEALAGLLAELDDGHVHLAAPNREVFDSNRIYRERVDDAQFDLELVREEVLDGRWETDAADQYTVATPAAGVVYLHLPRVAENTEVLDDVLDDHPGDALILDMRHNRGGDFTWAFAAFGRLTHVEREVFRTRTRNGPGRDDYDEWTLWSLQPRGPHDPRPVAVLTDRYTISAGERAVLALRQLPQVVHVGTATNGSQATKISRTLPNGWHFSLPVQQIEGHDGVVYEGPGIPPDVVVQGDPEALAEGRDLVLDHAIDLLSP